MYAYNLPWRCRASIMYVNYILPNLDTVIRRNLFGFIQVKILLYVLSSIPDTD